LIVEDNPADAEILTEVLTYGTNDRFDVEWVERVRSGADRLAELPRIDVVLVDLKLPDADGLEALDRIRDAADGAAIFVMTGFDDDALATEAKRRGARGYLVKGRLGASQLHALLREAVATGAARSAAVR
jgi:DNA-binding NarL/FixJ family response regulator